MTTNDNNNVNRRKHPRADMRYALSIRLTNRRVNVRTADLGYGGALIGSLVVAKTGTLVMLELSDDHGGGDCIARVVRHYRNGFAVQFVRPSEGFTRTLTGVLAPHIAPCHVATPPSTTAEVIRVDFRRKIVLHDNALDS